MQLCGVFSVLILISKKPGMLMVGSYIWLQAAMRLSHPAHSAPPSDVANLPICRVRGVGFLLFMSGPSSSLLDNLVILIHEVLTTTH